MEDLTKFTFIELWDILEQDFHCTFKEINYVLERIEVLQRVDGFDSDNSMRELLLQHGLIEADESGKFGWARKGMVLYLLLERLAGKSK